MYKGNFFIQGPYSCNVWYRSYWSYFCVDKYFSIALMKFAKTVTIHYFLIIIDAVVVDNN